MTTLLKTDFSDARVVPTDDPQWDKLVLPAGDIPIMYEDGKLGDRYANITDIAGKKALQFKLNKAAIPGDREGYYKGRVQLNCALPDVESVTMKTSMLLDLDAYSSYPKANGWFTIIELWSGAANSKYPFRISVNLSKDFGVDNPAFFSVTGSQRDFSGKWFTTWTRVNRSNMLPFGEWFQIELSCFNGDFRDGYLRLSMDDGILFDTRNWTYNRRAPAPVPFTMLQSCKLYTSGAVIDHMREAGQPARILWDSLEIST